MRFVYILSFFLFLGLALHLACLACLLFFLQVHIIFIVVAVVVSMVVHTKTCLNVPLGLSKRRTKKQRKNTDMQLFYYFIIL